MPEGPLMYTQPLWVLVVHIAGVVVFTVAWVAGVRAWFLSFREMKAMRYLRPEFFDRGPVAARRVIAVSPPPSQLIGEIRPIGECRMLFLSSKRAIFANENTTTKGTVVWRDAEAEITVRHAWGSTTFMRSLLTGWVAVGTVGLMYVVRERGRDDSWIAGVGILAGGAFLYCFYRFVQSRGRQNAERAVEAVAQNLRTIAFSRLS